VDYLFKPVVPEILRAKVSAFVDLFRKNREIQRQAEELRLLSQREHEARLAEARQRYEAQRLRDELQIARDIQQKLYPLEPPHYPAFEIAGYSSPAELAGGDYYDYIPMAEGTVGLAIGDASGHGVGPAILMAETRAYLRALALLSLDLGQMVALVNRVLTQDTRDEHFVTLFVGQLDVDRRSLRYVSAGHLPGYVLDSAGSVTHVLESTELPLGLVDGQDGFQSAEVFLQPGDTLLLLTDGIVEAADPLGQQFGLERARQVVRTRLNRPARQIVHDLHRTALEFAAHLRQRDDMSAIVVKTLAT
jgi:sigma-B regulation protein RsbU (phosphoserine phosphatase)